MATPPHWYTDASSKIGDATTKLTAITQGQGDPSFPTAALADVQGLQSDLDAAWQVVQQMQAQVDQIQQKDQATIADLQTKLSAANAALAKAKQGQASPPSQGATTATGPNGQVYVSAPAVAGIAVAALAAGGLGGFLLKGALAKKHEAKELQEGAEEAKKLPKKKKGGEA